MAVEHVPFTERSNPLSENIDVQNCEDIVEILKAVDEEVFTGWGQFKNIYSPTTITKISRIAELTRKILNKDRENNAVVLSGCGTSGRIAFTVARSFNKYLSSGSSIQQKESFYHYLVAGADKALIRSEEAEEDSWEGGAKALKEVIAGKKEVVFIGITCGLSASYVAGQLDYCLKNRNLFTAVVLLGFTLPCQARKTPIANWDKTFYDVCQLLLEEEEKQNTRRENTVHQPDGGERECELFIVTPVVGPEAITGSTRMKSGTATKVLLEIIFTLVHCPSDISTSNSLPVDLLDAYQLTCKLTYKCSSSIASLMGIVSDTLKADGNVCYLGVEGPGIMAIVDGTECPPTFGAAFDDIRGYLYGGCDVFGNRDKRLHTLGQMYQLSWSDFRTHRLSQEGSSNGHPLLAIFVLSADDLCDDVMKEVRDLCAEMSSLKHKIACIFIKKTKQTQISIQEELFDVFMEIELPLKQITFDKQLDALVHGFLSEAATKWTLNALSTGGHVQKGKIMKNRMVDVSVSNMKLFHRAVGIIQDFSSLDKEKATKLLISAIHQTDEVSPSLLDASLPYHIKVATDRKLVVPLALLLSSNSCMSVEEGNRLLSRNPIVRMLLIQTTN